MQEYRSRKRDRGRESLTLSILHGIRLYDDSKSEWKATQQNSDSDSDGCIWADNIQTIDSQKENERKKSLVHGVKSIDQKMYAGKCVGVDDTEKKKKEKEEQPQVHTRTNNTFLLARKKERKKEGKKR